MRDPRRPVLTRLELARASRGIAAADLARESGYSRQHLLRVRKGLIEPSRDCIAAIVSAVRALSLEDLRPDDLFELSREESGPWLRARRGGAAFVREWKRDRAQRAAFVQELRRQPRDRWLNEIPPAADAGTVRALIFEARAILDQTPADAEALAAVARAAIERIENLRPSYRAELLAHASLVRANALRQLGRLSNALFEIETGEAVAEGDPACTTLLGRAWLVRGTVLLKMGRLAEAEQWLRRAINIFSAVDDHARIAKVRVVQGGIHFERGAFEQARDAWIAAIPALSGPNDRHTLAVTWLNLGWCAIELGDFAGAEQWASQASGAFARLSSDVEVMRARWCLARLMALQGNRDAGVRALVELRTALTAREVHLDAAMVTLDVVEALLLDPPKPDLAAMVTARLLPFFQRAGASREALKALAYLAEAGASTRLRLKDVRHVRRFVRQNRASDREFVPLNDDLN